MSGAYSMFTARVQFSDGVDLENLRRVFASHEDEGLSFGDFVSKWTARKYGAEDLSSVSIHESLHFHAPGFVCTADQPMAPTMLGLGYKIEHF